MKKFFTDEDLDYRRISFGKKSYFDDLANMNSFLGNTLSFALCQSIGTRPELALNEFIRLCTTKDQALIRMADPAIHEILSDPFLDPFFYSRTEGELPHMCILDEKTPEKVPRLFTEIIKPFMFLCKDVDHEAFFIEKKIEPDLKVDNADINNIIQIKNIRRRNRFPRKIKRISIEIDRKTVIERFNKKNDYNAAIREVDHLVDFQKYSTEHIKSNRGYDIRINIIDLMYILSIIYKKNPLFDILKEYKLFLHEAKFHTENNILPLKHMAFFCKLDIDMIGKRPRLSFSEVSETRYYSLENVDILKSDPMMRMEEFNRISNIPMKFIDEGRRAFYKDYGDLCIQAFKMMYEISYRFIYFVESNCAKDMFLSKVIGINKYIDALFVVNTLKHVFDEKTSYLSLLYNGKKKIVPFLSMSDLLYIIYYLIPQSSISCPTAFYTSGMHGDIEKKERMCGFFNYYSNNVVSGIIKNLLNQ